MDTKINNQVIFYKFRPTKNKKPDVLKRTTGFFYIGFYKKNSEKSLQHLQKN